MLFVKYVGSIGPIKERIKDIDIHHIEAIFFAPVTILFGSFNNRTN